MVLSLSIRLLLSMLLYDMPFVCLLIMIYLFSYDNMVIPIHHTETVPVMNCWEWYVFTKTMDWWWWHCVTEEEYEIQSDITHTNAMYCIIFWLVISAVLFIVIYLWDKYGD